MTELRAQLVEHHGLYASEQEVMDLHDAGRSLAEIVASVGRSPQRVRAIVETFRIDGADSWAHAARQGSRALLAAIKRHHPEAIGAAS